MWATTNGRTVYIGSFISARSYGSGVPVIIASDNVLSWWLPLQRHWRLACYNLELGVRGKAAR